MNCKQPCTQVIIGDWGSSHLRLRLCEVSASGLQLIATAEGQGIKDVADPEAVLRDVAGAWLSSHGPLPIYLSGMVGSSIGWREAPYAACPATANDLKAATLRFRASELDIAIAPGLSATNMVGMPDVMRGEEVQLFGWLAGQPDDETVRWICLPGTHAKWVRTTGRRVDHFITSMQGEMYDLLLRHGLLGRSLECAWSPSDPIDMAAFEQGARLMGGQASLSLEHAVFSMRARRVMGDLGSMEAPSFLSGIFIAAELRDGAALLSATEVQPGPLVLIGSARLMELYCRAASVMGLSVETAVDERYAVEGLAAIAGVMVP